jgi:hypothetical protein
MGARALRTTEPALGCDDRYDACTPRMPRSTTHHRPQELLMSTTATREIDWQRDVDQAIAEAGRTHRPILLDFTAAPL